MSSYKYKAYSLNFHSCIPIPQLPVSSEEHTDVKISWGKIDWYPPKEQPEHRCWKIDVTALSTGQKLKKDAKRGFHEK